MWAADVGFPGPDDCVRYDTTRQRNAHVTEIRSVLYRWHPWHGREVFIFGSKTKNERAIFRCALNPSDTRVLEIPQWMFDAGTCCRMTLSAVPSISVRSLRELAGLLSMTGTAADCAVLIPEKGFVRFLQSRSVFACDDHFRTWWLTSPMTTFSAHSASPPPLRRTPAGS